MLSLGASGLVGQAAGGFILTFGHVLRPGEWVRVGEIKGAVRGVGMFSTRIRTPTDEEVNVRRGVDPRDHGDHRLQRAVAPGARHAAGSGGTHAGGRAGAAALRLLQTALSDYYVQYSLRSRLRDQKRRPAVLSTLNAHVQDVFNEYGVQIMSPHYVLDPPAPVVVSKEHWFDPPAAAGTRQ